MTSQQIVKIVSAVATSLDGVLAYGDRVADIPGINPSIAHAWPLIFLGIVAVDRGLHAYLGEPPANPPANLQPPPNP